MPEKPEEITLDKFLKSTLPNYAEILRREQEKIAFSLSIPNDYFSSEYRRNYASNADVIIGSIDQHFKGCEVCRNNGVSLKKDYLVSFSDSVVVISCDCGVTWGMTSFELDTYDYNNNKPFAEQLSLLNKFYKNKELERQQEILEKENAGAQEREELLEKLDDPVYGMEV